MLLLKISDDRNVRKQQCRNLFLKKNRLKLPAATIFIKKHTLVKVFSCECWETFKTYFTIFMDE